MKTDLKLALIDLEDFLADYFRDIPEPAHASTQDHLNWVEKQIAASRKSKKKNSAEPRPHLEQLGNSWLGKI